MFLVQENTKEVPYNEALLDINSLTRTKVYSKVELSRLWGVGRRTVQRWHDLALEYAPKYCEGFAQVKHVGNCPQCSQGFDLSGLQQRQAQRRCLIVCPHCREGIIPQVKILETTDKALKIPGKYAQVLRFVGFLVSSIGATAAVAALTTDPKYRKIRCFIRGILR